MKPQELLEDDTLQFLADNGLEALSANIWSWLPGSYPIWHIDQQKPNDPIVAINFLLEGDAGRTGWIGFDKVRRLTEDSVDPEYGTPDQRFISLHMPDFSSSIRMGVPMMIRTDIPHKVSRDKNSSIRWTARIFLRKIGENAPIQWDEAERILGKYKLSS